VRQNTRSDQKRNNRLEQKVYFGMTTHTEEPAPQKPLRLWPGVVAGAILAVLLFGVPIFMPEAVGLTILIGAVLALLILIWWLFLSRAPWPERVGALVVMSVALLATSRVVHPSISNAGMGMLLPIYGAQLLSVALVVALVASRRLSKGFRRASIVAAILLGCGVFTLLRTGGVSGNGVSDWHWRWTQTPEDRLLAQASDEPQTLPSVPEPTVSPEPASAPAAAESASSADEASKDASKEASNEAGALAPGATAPKKIAEWPGFRGPRRDSVIRGVRIETDWSQSPPVKLWQRQIGPGWSSFAVHGDFIYTQEQRGQEELVACYKLSTGEPVWRHRDLVRFWESNGGAGPRATPTLSNGRLYTFGATGILNVLNAANGAVIWKRDVASDTDTKVPQWGFASSPLVADNLVIVAAAGTLAAYDLASGQLKWTGPAHRGGYSSPHRTTIDGVPQILLESSAGLTSIAPATGAVLWEHAWEGGTIVQPALITNSDLLISTSDMSGGVGMRRLAVAHASGAWNVEERWTSNGLKPYFNDFVTHKGCAFGFDGSILACIGLDDGKRKWKGGRYGNGQMVLLADQDLLLVLSEEGELALVGATPDQYKELARVPGIEGKTWNHPALVGDILLVRNGEEMAAFRLALSGH
jgi:outer membrane protein assembly factor BamB